MARLLIPIIEPMGSSADLLDFKTVVMQALLITAASLLIGAAALSVYFLTKAPGKKEFDASKDLFL